MKKVSFNNLCRRLAIALIASFSICCLCSCANDEPEDCVNYYLSVQSRTMIYRRGGLPPAPKADLIGLLSVKMKQAIREAYPTPNLQGDDRAVLVACDEAYRMYSDTGMRSYTVCVLELYRVKMSGNIIKQSTLIKTYRL